jgi:ribosomal protein L2
MVKVYKPTSAGRRGMTGHDFSELSKKPKRDKTLTRSFKKWAGRNSAGRVSVRHRGGGHKRLYRIIDFKRNKFDVPAEVVTLEYDPNRSARIAKLLYQDGTKTYIIAPLGLQVGDTVMNGPNAELKAGNALPLKNIPVAWFIILNFNRVAAVKWRVRRGQALKFWVSKATMFNFVCPAVKCVSCMVIVWPPSGKSATPITAM